MSAPTPNAEMVRLQELVRERLVRFDWSNYGLDLMDDAEPDWADDLAGRLVAEIFGPRPEPVDEQAWRECAHRADYTSAAHHERECPYHRGEVDEWGTPVDDVPPNAGSAS